MAGQHPPSSTLPWAFVIEVLANVKEISVTTLINIFNKSPKITSDVGSNAREMVSLRILERLFDPDTRPKSLLCASNSAVTFDLTERCEDVLRHILGEMHEPNVWDKSEKSKWDAQPFIAYKRSCLLKSDSKQLNGTVMEGSPSNLISLKQMVTSLRLNQPGTRIHDVNGAIFQNQQQSPHIDSEVCQDTSSEHTRAITLNVEDGDDMDESIESESSSDDRYHKEMNAIAAKKQVFLSSNCKDGEVDIHKKEATRCIKCNEGGQLLICSSDACSFLFHDSCLVSTSSFNCDSTGKFYCPFCRYSQSISDFRVVKRKASSARNDLVSFSSSMLKHIPKKYHMRLCVAEQSATSEHKVTNEKDETSNKSYNNIVTQVINTQYKDSNKHDLKKTSNECRKKGIKRPLTMIQSIHESRAKSQRQSGVLNPDLSIESSENNGRVGCSEGSSEQADRMDRSFQKQIKPCTSLLVPQRRRVPVPWTQFEEETLKKWMEKFLGANSIHDSCVPWSKILELGAPNFQKGRKPGDLKDKWRNMQKASRNLI